MIRDDAQVVSGRSLNAGKTIVESGVFVPDDEYHHLFLNMTDNIGCDNLIGRMERKICHKGSFGFIPSGISSSVVFDVPDPLKLILVRVPVTSVGSISTPDMVLGQQNEAIKRMVLAAYQLPKDADRLMVDYLCLAMVRGVASMLGSKPPSMMDGRIDRAIEYIQDNLASKMSLSELAGVAAMSEFHFARSFKLATGMTPHRYVTGKRAEAAKMAIAATKEPLAGIAVAFGFASQSHMTTVFSKLFGITPGQMRG